MASLYVSATAVVVADSEKEARHLLGVLTREPAVTGLIQCVPGRIACSLAMLKQLANSARTGETGVGIGVVTND